MEVLKQVGGGRELENTGSNIKYSGKETIKTWSKASGGNTEEALGLRSISEIEFGELWRSVGSG